MIRTDALTDQQRRAVLELAAQAESADAVAPLSEQFRLDLRPGSGAVHLLEYAAAAPGPAGAAPPLAGYAQLAQPDRADGPVELVVRPRDRRQGVGSRLLAELPGAARIWAHGAGAAVDGFAAARGLRVVRELLVLVLPDLPGADLPPVVLPDDLHARAFEPGRDDADWVATNAAAFAAHPEQGRLTVADLHERLALPWFDPAGLLLVVPRDASAEPRIAGFHWTKVDPAQATGPDASGEVYVVGVHPAYQGRGLGRPVTLLGLHHLRGLGLPRVHLYVDGDNAPALAVYRALGFRTHRREVMFVLP